MNERVKAIRKILKLSQEAFGKKLGVTGAGISKIESGDRSLTPQMMLHICQLFKVNKHWLETGKGEMFDDDPLEASNLDEALHIFKTLRPELQEYALEQIRLLAKLQEKL